jgi:hypothetical protein
MEANDFAFGPYTGTEWGFATLLERLLLQGYNDDGSLMHSLPIALKQKKKLPQELYLQEAERFIDFSTRLISDRAELIIKSLHLKLH